MKAVFWIILGLCVWFVPSIGAQFSSETGEFISLPIEIIIGQFIVAIILIIKGVLTFRQERKEEKSKEEKSKKEKSKKEKKKKK